jgi:hypothetical protein
MSDHADDRKVSHDYVEDSGSVDLNAVAMAATYVPGTDAEKALVWKIDKHIIVSLLVTWGPLSPLSLLSQPTIWLLYMLGYLDRANIGNAKTGEPSLPQFANQADPAGGLERDLNLSSTQYSVVLLVFFVSYVIFEIPSNLLIAVSPFPNMIHGDMRRYLFFGFSGLQQGRSAQLVACCRTKADMDSAFVPVYTSPPFACSGEV